MIKKPFVIRQKKFFDKRGFFQEIYKKKTFKTSLLFTAVAYSKKNVIRGLHFQTINKQTKIIHLINGKILDVAVNLRRKSKDFGKVYKFNLSAGDIILIPNFYAHGYECLSSNSTIIYHTDKYRNKKSESGIKFNDKSLDIKWKTKKPNISVRDKKMMSLIEFKINIYPMFWGYY